MRSCLLLFGVLLWAGCARLPPAAPPLNVERVRELLDARLDTLDLGAVDTERYFSEEIRRSWFRLRDTLNAIGATGDLLKRADHIVRVNSQDSLRSAYQDGVEQAVRDLQSGSFHLMLWDLDPIGRLRVPDRGRCWMTFAVWSGILQREYRVQVEGLQSDGSGGRSHAAFGEGYNRIAEPVIAAYWGVPDVQEQASERVSEYVNRGAFAEHSYEC